LRGTAPQRAVAAGATDRAFETDRDRLFDSADWPAAATIGGRPDGTLCCSSVIGDVAAEKAVRNPSAGKGADGALGLA
jgi:hypothetical protein